MERPSFSDRIDKTVADVQAAQRAADQRAELQAEQDRQRHEELQEARERMRQLYREAAAHLAESGIQTEVGKVYLGTNGGGVIGYRQPATEFVLVNLPEGWVIGKNTKGEPVEVLTPEGRIFHATVANEGNQKVGRALETTPDSYTQHAVDENGPYLASHDPYGEAPPLNLEEAFMTKIAKLL